MDQVELNDTCLTSSNIDSVYQICGEVVKVISF